jgi:ubiquinone/menaquinone biosynthesis C-methylase UbiE
MTAGLELPSDSLYRDSAIVNEYASLPNLFKVERLILEIIRERLHEMVMLDVGIGGGRTTGHFAPLVREYVGVDLSQPMVDECRRRYGSKYPHARFARADVRDLRDFPADTFDFVLFSFNGLDSVPGTDRSRALREIRRVGKRGALFCFSAHNIQHLPYHFAFRHTVSYRPLRFWKTYRAWRALLRANPEWQTRIQQPSGMFFDGAHDLRLQQVYIRPAEQVRQLREHFDAIRIFPQSAREVNESALNDLADAWIYYLCVMS